MTSTLPPMEDAPQNWPQRLSREQAKAAKERERRFKSVLKTQAKAAGWHFANGTIFRQHKDWFASALPSLLWQRGVVVMPMAKPMGVDPMFWKIVGLSENEALPLSFRANGAWVLRPPSPNVYVALQEDDPIQLAGKTLAWADKWLAEVDAKSLDALIFEIESLGASQGQAVALEVCLHLLRGDRLRALEIVRARNTEESAGFRSGESTFLQQAEAWISAMPALPNDS